MTTLQNQAINAAEKYIIRREYEVLDTNWQSETAHAINLVAEDDSVLVFIDVLINDDRAKGMPAEDVEGARQRMENAAAAWLADHCDNSRFTDCPIRFDVISMMLIGENSALIRHHVNALGGDMFNAE